jgi:hypothetical protein
MTQHKHMTGTLQGCEACVGGKRTGALLLLEATAAHRMQSIYG